jgi:UDP-perosamine 4-acetyltransferase
LGKSALGDGVFVGANSTILPRLKIGNWVTIGAGAVVTKDVEDFTIVAGIPARVIGFNKRSDSDNN